MAPPIARTLPLRLAGRFVGPRLSRALAFDFGLGFALLRDRRVPMRTKAIALGVSAAVMAGLVALEVPIEGLLALVLPLLGGMIDLAADGAEEAIGTLFLATWLLPRLAPRGVVEAVRRERSR